MEGNVRGKGTPRPRDPSKTLRTQLRAASPDPNPAATLGAALGHACRETAPEAMLATQAPRENGLTQRAPQGASRGVSTTNRGAPRRRMERKSRVRARPSVTAPQVPSCHCGLWQAGLSHTPLPFQPHTAEPGTVWGSRAFNHYLSTD